MILRHLRARVVNYSTSARIVKNDQDTSSPPLEVDGNSRCRNDGIEDYRAKVVKRDRFLDKTGIVWTTLVTFTVLAATRLEDFLVPRGVGRTDS